MSRRRSVLVWGLIAAVLIAVVVGRLLIGSTGWGVPDHAFADIVMGERLKRVVVALIVGVALAVSGVALQALLRNPLAEPYILGLSTGAGLGILAQGYLALQLNRAPGPEGLGAALGTLLTLCIVFFASRRNGVIDRLGLLLVGVVLSTINGAAILLLSYLAKPSPLRKQLANWMMGLLPPGMLGWTDVVTASVTAAGLVVLFWQGRAMDVSTLDDDEAASLGVNTARLKLLLLVIASALTAMAVLLAGPIAFVGLIAPHVARALLGPSHRPLLIGAALLGAALLIGADFASATVLYIDRSVGGSIGRIPVGIFTAMIGGPVFLWLLRPQLGRGME